MTFIRKVEENPKSCSSINSISKGGSLSGIQKILRKYKDVFPEDLPKELPPRRTIDHQIEVIPGFDPPSRPTYTLSPKEQDELKAQL